MLLELEAVVADQLEARLAAVDLARAGRALSKKQKMYQSRLELIDQQTDRNAVCTRVVLAVTLVAACAAMEDLVLDVDALRRQAKSECKISANSQGDELHRTTSLASQWRKRSSP